MNQKGFSIISLIATLPVILTIIAGVLSFGLYLNNASESLFNCRKELLSIQRDMIKSMNALFALNPHAQYLRTEERILEAQLAAAPPPAKAAIFLKLQINREKQALLHSQQLNIISLTNARATQRVLQLRAKVHADTWNTSMPRLAVRATPRAAIAPDYEPIASFEKSQAIEIHWTRNRSKYLRGLHDAEKILPTMKGTCSATITKNSREQWIAKLGTVSL